MQIVVRINKVSKPTEYILNRSVLFYPRESIKNFQAKMQHRMLKSSDSTENFKTANLKCISL